MIKTFMLLGCLLSGQALAADPQPNQFSRPLIITATDSPTLTAINLDAEIYAHTDQDFSNLRLIDQNGVAIPFLLQAVASSKPLTQNQLVPSKVLSLQKTAVDGIEIRVDLLEAATVNGLSIDTQQHDFEYRLQVAASNDGEHWQSLVENALIYDYARYMAVSNHEVTLPSNPYRQFKISIAKAEQQHNFATQAITLTNQHGEEQVRSETTTLQTEPLHIDGIRFWQQHTELQPNVNQITAIPLSDYKISTNPEQKTSIIDLTVPKLPLTGFEITTPANNFSRQVSVLIPVHKGMETQLQQVAQGKLEKLQFQDIHHEQNQLNFAEQRQDHYQLIIQNQDNPPLAISGINGLSNNYQIVFLAQPQQTYLLQYGYAQTTPAHYDTVAISELQKRGYPASIANLGTATTQPQEAKPRLIYQFLNNSFFLGLIIVVMVLVLGWSLYKVAKRVNELSDK